ncbi:MAG: DegT/DnrJ/EryC1/StrS family aminotransferase, partial [Vicinamibacterales bacterium]
LRHVTGLVTPAEPIWARSNWQSYAIRLVPPLSQRRVMQRMLDEGISTRRGVMNAHREPACPPGSFRVGVDGLAQSELAQDTAVVLPLYHQMTTDEQDRVIASLARAIAADE